MEFSVLLSSVREILLAIKRKHPVQEVMSLILNQALEIAQVSNGCFVAVEEKTQRLRIVATAGPGWTDETKSFHVKMGEGIVGKAAATAQPYVVQDVTQDPQYIPMFDFVKSELAVPIVVEEKVWGIINIDGIAVNAFNQRTIEWIMLLAELASSAISMQRELEKQKELQERLLQSEKLAALGQVISGIAHEINNPLTAILGNACLMEMKIGKPIEEKPVQAIISEGQRCAELIKDMLSFARRTPSKAQTFGVNEVLRQAHTFMRHQFKTKGFNFTVQLPEESYPIHVDRRQLQQGLINLLSNALQAFPEGQKDATVVISAELKGEKVLIHVKDNGPGIPHDIRSRIFEPFFTTKPVGVGTGLGLSLTYSFAQSHGGNLYFQTEINQGTTFTLELPLAHDKNFELRVVNEANSHSISEEQLTHLPAVNPLSSHLAKVLVIDDEMKLLHAISDYLRSESYEVECCTDAESGLKQALENDYDVIVADIRLPGMDGLQFYQQLIEQKPAMARRFVFMTGELIRDEMRDRITQTHCFCLEKPFAFQVLKNTLSLLVEEKTQTKPLHLSLRV